MNTVITPTVGRVVWFFQTPQAPEPRAAIITYVHSPGMVNLVVFNANGEPIPTTSVPLCQDGDERPAGFRCEWMPYQKGQAAKTEALREAINLAVATEGETEMQAILRAAQDGYAVPSEECSNER